MKRDDDYIRELLLEFEAHDDWLVLAPQTLNPTPEERSRQYHIMLLADAGFATNVGQETYRLTKAGHDYLDAVRDEGIWAKTKAAVAETGGNATLEIVKKVALGFVKKKIEQHTGLEL